jgi:hypothetical protein
MKRTGKSSVGKRNSKTRGSSGRHQNSPVSKRAGLAEPIDGIDFLAETLIGKINVGSLQWSGNTGPRTIKATIRDAVLEGISAVDIHRTWLAEIDRISRNTEDVQELRNAIAAYLRQAGIERLAEFSDATRFVVSSDDGVGIYLVTQPAYIDVVTGRTILAGRARREQVPDELRSDVPAPKKQHTRARKANGLWD